MKNLNEYITEAKNSFFGFVKSILEKDEACKKVIDRTNRYDANRSNSDQLPKILLKEGNDYSWYTINMIDKELDIAAPKDIIGIYIDRMFYPISDKQLILDIIERYNEINK